MRTLEEQRAHYRAVQQRIARAAAQARAERQIKKLAPPPPPPPPLLPKIAETVPPIPKLENFKPTFNKLVEFVAEKHGLEPEAVLDPCRSRPLYMARFELYYLARERLGYSWHAIGTRVGRDHTSVLHGYRRFKKMLEAGEVSDPITPSTVLGLRQHTKVGPGV